MSKYLILLFDADDTLFDFQKAEERALKQVFYLYQISYTKSKIDLYKEINHKLWKDFELGNIEKDVIQKTRFTKLFEELHIEKDGLKANNDYLEFLANGSDLIDGAYELCEALAKQYKLYIVTNGISKVQHKRFEHCKIKPFITDIFVSEDSGYQKPQKEYFEYVFDKIGNVEKDKVLLIGDSLSSDIMGGNQIGVTTCWFNQNKFENKSDAISDYEIHKLEELFNIIK
ncbi:YjjG family noncanonical pyrimidine nucleotidase [Paludicola sp. MB14-C6]|uniref:YjjG family noncanonical pyrimidine nucleotidase n=1 Tax=Paludihabitans sp. MB14-C6 TaxID=3070656 RepID=UPI0027DC2807|nr:YjjG family noncanonical pyrimidine nucleotidase [Paludicola sp. MB14-C6]WMJ21958.1 YjjG family noncanonical pyrimidine nucleotidase [Paludicola sp. MB14-C6]